MIVATAGHIDHGKTLLVRNLTGVDTDRLPEEKQRGISIDLGFAYLATPDGGVLGFVDVPGHERFIRNMLAGVCGIDEALLVVAADDGVMPQTREHLQILDLLNVRRAIAVVNKADRVSESRLDEVVESVRALLEGTTLAGSPVMAVSALTGAGVAELRDRLFADARALAARHAEGRRFRFAIDRVFSVSGSGTVVTGTVFNGRVRTGDRLSVSPEGIPVRVRALQARGLAAEAAEAGQRCALNLTGTDLEKKTIHRGDWVLDEALHRPTRRLDARVKVLASEASALAHWTPVHLHLGTADVTARVAIRRGESVPPGESRVVQLLLDRPVGALHADRFILRDQSATRTLGGGVVLDPFAPAGRSRAAVRQPVLQALETDSPAEALGNLLGVTADGVDLDAYEATFALTRDAADAIYASASVAILGRTQRIGISAGRREALRSAIVEAVAKEHRDDPRSLGVETGAIGGRIGSRMPDWALTQLLRELADERKVEIAGTRVRRPGHDATSNPEDERLWQRILPQLERDKPLPPTIKEIAESLRVPERAIRDLLHRKSRAGEPIKVMDDRFFLQRTVLRLARQAQETAAAADGGQFTAAQYRDSCGASRKLAIEVLEFFDRIGYTQRLGDARRIRRPIEQALAGRPSGGAAPRR